LKRPIQLAESLHLTTGKSILDAPLLAFPISWNRSADDLLMCDKK
jgi:hypothetical protein